MGPSPTRSELRPRSGLSTALLVASLALGGATITRLQPRTADALHAIKGDEDVYVLPPPAQIRAMTLGYTAAAADLLWAKLLVEYGIHHAEKRAFPDLETYLEGILALEPDYANVYKYVDILVAYRPPRGWEKDARTARRFLERGLEARPNDGDVWLHYGDFLAFIAPAFLEDQAEIQEWRRRGAEALFRAGELGAGVERALSAASLLSKAGERDAAIRQLERSYALTDDPDDRARIAAQLEGLEASRTRDRVTAAVRALEGQWKAEYPFVPRSAFLLLGPVVDAHRCAGLASADLPACSHAWDGALAAPEP